MTAGTFFITGDAEADKLLHDDALALLLGMLLDQQVPMEWAFASPAKLRDRLGGRLDAAEIAAMESVDLELLFKDRPALHRFPGSMAKRAWELCRTIADDYDNDTTKIWSDTASGQELLGRLAALPGFGQEKARIFLAVLAKRLDVKPAGWQEACSPFGDDVRRSVADADSPEHLLEVRAFKQAMKAANKDKQGKPATKPSARGK
jgi:uncharacterized HhH-GPD family protein